MQAKGMERKVAGIRPRSERWTPARNECERKRQGCGKPGFRGSQTEGLSRVRERVKVRVREMQAKGKKHNIISAVHLI